MYRSPIISGDGPLRITRPRSLPHWYRSRAAYFVTFRLAGSLPVAALAQIRERLRQSRSAHPEDDESHHSRLAFAAMEQALHDSPGVYLRDSECEVVRDALLHFDGDRYRLAAWCIMPNHVHLVLQLCDEHQIAAVVQSLKRFTSTRINTLRGTRGPLWQKEYFDRLIRDDEEFQRCVEYTLANPAKAGLDGWQWVGFAGGSSLR